MAKRDRRWILALAFAALVAAAGCSRGGLPALPEPKSVSSETESEFRRARGKICLELSPLRQWQPPRHDKPDQMVAHPRRWQQQASCITLICGEPYHRCAAHIAPTFIAR